MRGWTLEVVANPKGHRFAAAALVAAVWRAAILAALLDYTKRAVIVVVWARVPAWPLCETSVNVTFWFGVAPTNLFAVDQEQVRAVEWPGRRRQVPYF